MDALGHSFDGDDSLPYLCVVCGRRREAHDDRPQA